MHTNCLRHLTGWVTGWFLSAFPFLVNFLWLTGCHFFVYKGWTVGIKLKQNLVFRVNLSLNVWCVYKQPLRVYWIFYLSFFNEWFGYFIKKKYLCVKLLCLQSFVEFLFLIALKKLVPLFNFFIKLFCSR